MSALSVSCYCQSFVFTLANLASFLKLTLSQCQSNCIVNLHIEKNGVHVLLTHLQNVAGIDI